MEFLKDYLALIMASLAGVAAYFNIKSDARDHEGRIAKLEEKQTMVRENAREIALLKEQNAAAAIHREGVNSLLERLDRRAENQDCKLDSIQQTMAGMAATLQHVRDRD